MLTPPMDQLVKILSRLPGLGQRSAKRILLHMLKRRNDIMIPLAQLISETADQIQTCDGCGNLDLQNPCQICADPTRHKHVLCIVEQVDDIWAMERTGAFRGTYFALGGVLSALDGITPDDLGVPKLLEKLKATQVDEIILALSATVDGQTTAHYLVDHIQPMGINITRLAHGLPVGGSLDYLDEGTITTALNARSRV